MEIRIELPMITDGEWRLVDAADKVLADNRTHPGAKLIANPVFIKGGLDPVVGRCRVIGEAGGINRQLLKVNGSTGLLSTSRVKEDKTREPVKPRFDKIKPGGKKP